MDSQDIHPSSAAVRIPGYDLLEIIGEGGMGVVYRAEQHQPRRLVAIKFLTAFPSTRLSVEAFEREARLMAAVHHPHVVTIHDCGQVEGRYYIVMEYVSGSPLRSLMKPGQPWPVSRAGPILDSIALALSYIHNQGILHLDLKPENVLCAEDGSIKITDFGLALRRVDAWTLSDLGVVQGSIDYCPPEQRYGLPIDQRGDLFSLATLAYELLTGAMPGRVYVPASQRNSALPTALDDVLRKGLARDPDERYRSVEEFRRELESALAPPVVGPVLRTALWLALGVGELAAEWHSLAAAPSPVLETVPVHDLSDDFWTIRFAAPSPALETMPVHPAARLAPHRGAEI